MKIIQWNENFLTDVDVIDKAHKSLFSTVQRMSQFFDQDNPGKWKFACQEGLKFLKNYTATHCAEEEEYMRSINYEHYAAHKRMHDNFRDNILPSLEKELEASDYSAESIRKFIGMCLGWLTGHIVTEDLAIVGKRLSKLKDVSSDAKDIDTLKQLLADTMEGMTKVKAEVVSETYTGEYFGDALFYEMVYNYVTARQEIQVLIGLEERLLLQSATAATGVPFTEVNTTVISLMEEIAQATVNQLGTMFIPPEHKHYFQNSRLISPEVFEKTLEQKLPRYSLLFQTEMGHFSFCVDILQ